MTDTRSPSMACRKGIFLQGTFNAFLQLICIFLLLLAGACKEASRHPQESGTYSGPRLFKDTSLITYSRGFSLQYFGNYKLLKILNHFTDRSDTITYVLLQRGTPAPAGYPKAQIIEVPVQKMVVTSSMHIGMLDFAEATGVLAGLAESKYVNAPAVRKGLADGKVVEVGNGSGMNDELIVSMHPGLVMTMSSPSAQFARYKNLINTGVPVLINAEWLETDPLGRSEWVKVIGALLNREALVNKKFDALAKEYNRLKALTASVKVRPSVIIGMPFKGTWFVPDGDSYTTCFIKDAGASYKWSDVKGTGSLPLNFETVAPVALTADFWLNAGDVHTLQDIAARDERYTRFRPYRQAAVYNNNKRVNDIGANDYWESGAVNPQTILADMIRIIHPELLPAHELVYYKQLK